MRYDEIIAATHDEAYSMVRKKFGDNATIISTSEVPVKGVLGIFKRKQIKMTVSISDDDYLKFYKDQLGILDLAQKTKVPSGSKAVVEKEKENTMQLMLEKLDKLERKIESKEKKEFKEEEHKSIRELRDILIMNEFSENFIAEIVENIKNTLPISKIEDRIEVQKYAYHFLENKIAKIIGSDEKFYHSNKNVVILVGPTGVGKTTTIAKIAANAHINEKKEVELITIDGFRIGAKHQLKIYADYLQMNLHFAEDNLQVGKAVTLSTANLILVDTIGRSQQDGIKLAEMRSMLKIKNIPSNFLLVISATTKSREVRNIFKNFSIFDYDQVIITKNDESDTIGSIISAAIEYNKKILFCTVGQKVPTDIEKASIGNLMNRIVGFDQSVYLLNIPF